MKVFGIIVLLLWAISITTSLIAESQYVSVDTGLGLTMLNMFVIWPLTGVTTAIFIIALVLKGTENTADENLRAEQIPSELSSSHKSEATPRHRRSNLLTKLIALCSITIALTIVAIPLTLLFDVSLPDFLNSSSRYPLGFRLLQQALPIEIIILFGLAIIYLARKTEE
jgi:hypothetical protein